MRLIGKAARKRGVSQGKALAQERFAAIDATREQPLVRAHAARRQQTRQLAAADACGVCPGAGIGIVVIEDGKGGAPVLVRRGCGMHGKVQGGKGLLPIAAQILPVPRAMP